MYGPETFNPVTFMSFIQKQDGCSKIAEFKRKLVQAGYNVPKFTTVLSAFSKLCEGLFNCGKLYYWLLNVKY
jgi:hypothetical protein